MPTSASCIFALTELPVNYQAAKTITQGEIFCEAALIGTPSIHLSPTREEIWTRTDVEQLIPSDALWKKEAHLACIEHLWDGL